MIAWQEKHSAAERRVTRACILIIAELDDGLLLRDGALVIPEDAPDDLRDRMRRYEPYLRWAAGKEATHWLSGGPANIPRPRHDTATDKTSMEEPDSPGPNVPGPPTRTPPLSSDNTWQTPDPLVAPDENRPAQRLTQTFAGGIHTTASNEPSRGSVEQALQYLISLAEDQEATDAA